MGHDHHHHSGSGNIKVAFFLNLAFTIIELIGGLYVNSVAILSDAVHDLGDSLSLGTAWYLQNKSDQQADEKFSFGYRRFSLLGALVTSIVLIVGAVYVVQAAIGRILHPEPTDAQGMMWFALLGIAVNGYAAWKLSHGRSMNEKVVSWHMIEDVLGWVAILVAAVVLQFKDIPFLDPALSLLITAYVLWNVLKRLKETLYLFLQGTPLEMNAEAIETGLLGIENVCSVHHTHIWSLDGQHHVFSTHLKLHAIDTLEQQHQVKKDAKAFLSRYSFSHSTIETELDEEQCELMERGGHGHD